MSTGASRPTIRAVLFDLGGTMIDVRDFGRLTEIARSLHIAIESDHLAHAFEQVNRETDGPVPVPLADFWQRVLTRASGREVPVVVAEQFLAEQLRAPERIQIFSDTKRCLETLREEGRRLGVVSNSRSETYIRGLMEDVGIQSYFSVVVSSGTEGVAKPDAEIFRRGVERIGVRPEEAFYVGDLAYTDAKAARLAGLHSVWLHREGTGFGDDPPEITSLLELPLWIRRLETGEERSSSLSTERFEPPAAEEPAGRERLS